MHHRTPQTPVQSPARRGGFTLVELMASIALVLLLVLGINQVFSIASRGIGAGQALSTVQRDNRTGHSVIYTDLRNAVTTDQPFFIIRSERVSAFRNRQEMEGDRDYANASGLAAVDLAIRTTDVDGNNSEADPVDVQSVASLTNRNHRVDSIRFFARDFFRRQTGNDDVFVSDIAGPEAYIVYGHLNQPNDAAGVNLSGSRNPGARHAGGVQSLSANPNNFFAQQWILGRNVFVMRDPEQVSPTEHVILDGNVRQFYVVRSQTAFNTPASTVLSPFAEGSVWSTNGAGAGGAVQFSRYDLMGIGMLRARQEVTKAIQNRATPPGDTDEGWYDSVSFRFSGWPYPTRPLTSFGLARVSPTFIAACSQFCVEYAGDFLTQDQVTGEATVAEPDGETDFVPIERGAVTPANPVGKRIRWYGFPRNVDTSDDDDNAVPNGVRIQGATGADPGGTNILDVVPLRDVLFTIAGATESAVFERSMDPDPALAANHYDNLPPAANYAATGSLSPEAKYTCAWGPSGTFLTWAGAKTVATARTPASYGVDPPLPRMIRFVIGIDDPQGRLPEAQLYEYVVELP